MIPRSPRARQRPAPPHRAAAGPPVSVTRGRGAEARRRRDARRHRHGDRAEQRRRSGRRSRARSPRCTSARASSSSAGRAAVHARRAQRRGQRDQGAGAARRRTRRRSPTRSASSRAARTCSRRTSSRRARSTPTRRWSSRSRPSSLPTAPRSRPRRSASSYSRIVAPAAGRAGAINVFAGSCVQPSGAALVTHHPARPDRGRLQPAAAQPRPRRWQTLRDGGGKVTAVVRPTAAARLIGKLQFVDNTVDAGLGHGAGQGRVREQGETAVAAAPS